MISFAKIYFQGVRGGGFTGDIGIDDIKLKDCRTYLAQGKQTVVLHVPSYQKNIVLQHYQSCTLALPSTQDYQLPQLILLILELVIHAGLPEILETFRITRKFIVFHYLSWSVGFILKILFFSGKSANKFMCFFLPRS